MSIGRSISFLIVVICLGFFLRFARYLSYVFVALIQCSDKSNLKNKELTWGSQFQGTTVEKEWARELEAAGHRASIVRKQGR